MLTAIGFHGDDPASPRARLGVELHHGNRAERIPTRAARLRTAAALGAMLGNIDPEAKTMIPVERVAGSRSGYLARRRVVRR